jgi:hypothetical protein
MQNKATNKWETRERTVGLHDRRKRGKCKSGEKGESR